MDDVFRALADPTRRSLLDKLFKKDGQTLSALERRIPDLILMDIQLPGMDGLALTRHLRRDETLRDVPIVAFTTSAIKGDEEIARAAGCDGYITKPIDTRTFINVVREYF